MSIEDTMRRLIGTPPPMELVDTELLPDLMGGLLAGRGDLLCSRSRAELSARQESFQTSLEILNVRQQYAAQAGYRAALRGETLEDIRARAR